MAGMLPANRQSKSQLDVFAYEPARNDGWCRLSSCGERYRVGELIAQVRWGPEDGSWGTLHDLCYQSLPETIVTTKSPHTHIPMPPVDGNTLVIRKLPEGQRHHGHRYVVEVDEAIAYATGEYTKAVGAAECLSRLFGYRLDA